MNKYIILLFLSLLLFSNCYVYKPLEPQEDKELPTIKEQLQADKIYKINADGKEYKVKVVSWEQDSLVTQINAKEGNEKKFHINQISQVNHRIFSKGRSDFLTALSYAAAIGVIIVIAK